MQHPGLSKNLDCIELAAVLHNKLKHKCGEDLSSDDAAHTASVASAGLERSSLTPLHRRREPEQRSERRQGSYAHHR